jgi:hypothetical protein
MSSSPRLRRLIALAVSAAAASAIASPALAQTTTSWSAPLSGDWLDGTLWSTSPTYPNNGSSQTYQVAIDATGSPYTVTLGDVGSTLAGTITVSGLTLNSSDATLVLQSGTLRMADYFHPLQVNAGRLLLDSPSPTAVATLSGTSIAAGTGGSIDVRRGVFDGVEINRQVNVLGTPFSDGLVIRNGFMSGTSDGILSLQQATADAPARVTFDGTQATTSSGMTSLQVVFDAPGAANSIVAVTGGGTLTSNLVIRNGAGDGTIDLSDGYFENDNIISASGPGRSIHITSADYIKSRFTSLGSVTASNGAAVYVQTSFDADPFDDGSSLGQFSAQDNGTIYLGDPRPGAPSYSTNDLGLLSSTTGGKIVLTGQLIGGTNAVSTSSTNQNLQLDNLTASHVSFFKTASLYHTTFVASGNLTFDTVTASGITFDQDATLTIKNKLTVSGGLSFTDGNTVTTSGSATITGTGSINLGGASPSTLAPAPGKTLTLAPGTNLYAGTAFIGSGTAPGTLVLANGTLNADFGGLTLTNVTNNGTINASNYFDNGNITTAGAFTNNGTINLYPTGTLSLLDAWTSPGAIVVSGGRLNLGSTFTPADIPNVKHTSGDVYITGTLQNTGTTFTLNNDTGSWLLAPGSLIKGGTIASTAGQTFTAVGDAELSGVSVDMPLVVTDSTLSFTNGTSLADAGSVSLAGSDPNSDTILLLDSPTLSGTGQVTFDTADPFRADIRTSATASGLTIAPGITVRTGAGSGTVGQNTYPLLNQGTLSSPTPGSTLILTGTTITNTGTIENTGGFLDITAPLDNAGTLRVTNGRDISLTLPFTNTGTVDVDNATFETSGTWTNAAGTIQHTGTGAVTLGNSFTNADLGTITGDPAYVTIAGTLDNSSSTLTIQPSSGPGVLTGTLRSGTLAIAPGATFTPRGGTFDNVRLDADLPIPAFSLSLIHTLTITAGHHLTIATANPYGAVQTHGAASIQGPGEIVFDANGLLTPYDGSLTLGPSLTVRTGLTGGTVGTDTLPFTNQGLISAQTPGQTLTLNGSNWINQGTLQATNSSNLNLTGSYSFAPGSSLHANGGTVTLAGTLTNTGRTLAADPDGTIVLAGTVLGGTLRATPSASFQVASPTLDAVTLAGPFTLHNAAITARDGLTLDNATLTLGGSDGGRSSLYFDGDQHLAGTGQIIFNGQSQYAYDSPSFVQSTTGTLTIDPGVTILTDGGSCGIAATDGRIINNGIVRAQGPNQRILITAADSGTNAFVNQNLIEATAGAEIHTYGQFSNATGTVRADGGTVFLGDAHVGAPTYSTADLGALQAINGGQIVLGGYLNNVGTTLTASDATGDLTLGSITVTGGTLATSGTASFRSYSGINATLDNVTLAGRFAGAATLRNSLTLDNATIDLHGPGLWATDSPAITGTGLIRFTTSASAIKTIGIGTLSIGPGVTVATAGASGLLGENTTDRYVVSDAALLSQNPGQSLTLANFTNNGPILVSDGGSVTTAGDFTNNGSISVTNSGVLTLHGNWSSSVGTITMADAQVNFGGTFTPAALAHFSRSSGAVYLDGTLDLTGSAFPLNAATGSWKLANGSKILNGPVTASDGQSLTVVGNAELSGVTLATPVVVNYGSLTLSDDTSLSSGGSITLAPVDTSRQMVLQVNSTTLAGTGDVVFDDATQYVPDRVTGPAAGLTLAPGITVRTGTGNGNVGDTNTPLTNQGTLSARTAGHTLGAYGYNLTNAGTAEATNGATLNISATATLTNSGAISAQTPGSKITLTASTLTNTGSLQATNGATLAITASSFTNTGTVTIDPSSTLRLTNAAASAPSGTINLSGHAILNYTGPSPADAVRQQLALGRTGVTGILLPEAAADPTRALAYVEASLLLHLTGSQTSTWSGQPVDATSLLLLPTLAGDANLDGLITPDDYALLDRSYARSLSNAHWTDGDFNYDGAVDASDYLLIDTALGQAQGFSPGFLAQREQQFGAAYVSTLLSSVPEPSAIAGVFAGLGCAASRFRRRT